MTWNLPVLESPFRRLNSRWWWTVLNLKCETNGKQSLEQRRYEQNKSPLPLLISGIILMLLFSIPER